MKYSLIVPVAADKPEYNETLPYVFGLDEEGVVICIRAIMGMDTSCFDNIYFTILRKHDAKYCLSEMLQMQFGRLGLSQAKVVVLDAPTSSQPETIYQTIRKEHIEGAIFIKDSDCYFTCEPRPQNGVAIYPLEELSMVDPRNKSYVAVDDMFYVTNIIEKRVVSRYFNAGGYCFESSDEFCRYYERLHNLGHLYLSHIIYAMLLDKREFRPIRVKEYKDWGTMHLYKMDLINLYK
ncbi:MAG: hypothetical protein IJE21_03960 [Alistipes sp.]|nr:hypothetical protein [Alistipes sp.]